MFVFLIYIDRRFKIGHGRLFAAYVAAYCIGRFWVELLRDDTATHIAGIRVNSFTSVFVFIGAIVYIMLAPKGREDPATLAGKHADAGPAEESPAEKMAEDLVAVATGGGIAAAVSVAAEHDSEDAAAVGDVEEPEAEPEAERSPRLRLSPSPSPNLSPSRSRVRAGG